MKIEEQNINNPQKPQLNIGAVSERLFTENDMMNAWRMSAEWHIRQKATEVSDGDGTIWIREYVDEQDLNAH